MSESYNTNKTHDISHSEKEEINESDFNELKRRIQNVNEVSGISIFDDLYKNTFILSKLNL